MYNYYVKVTVGSVLSFALNYFSVNGGEKPLRGTYFIDIHSHIIPGVDDGSKDLRESVKMARDAYSSGTRVIIATPHYYTADNSIDKIKENFYRLSSILHKELPDLKLFLGNENYFHVGLCKEIGEGRSLALARSNCLLVEFSYNVHFDFLFKSLMDIFSNGYIPVLAHAERYDNLTDDDIDRIYQFGVHIQVNADSVTGEEFGQKKKVKRWLKGGLVDFIASDCHNTTGRPSPLLNAYRKTVKMCGKEYADKVFCKNAEEMIFGAEFSE